MKLSPQSPKKALKAFLKQKPLRSQIDLFKANLIALLDKISIIEKQPKDESEEHLKNNLRDFLRDTYYRDTNAINTKDKKDLVIHLNKTTDSNVAVIIEAKRPTNIGEMITTDNPNKKALHELILYYLNERNQAENNQLKQLVATNIYEWFIIDANYFDKHIYRNTQIKKLYETKLNDKKDNPWFYEEVTKIISKIDVEIPCIFFDIREFETYLRNTKKEDDKELIALFKILSPEHLLKIATPNDSNSLDEKFYKELLHIIGLEEAKEGGKNIIRRKKEKRNAASLIELAIEALKTEDTFHRVPDIRIYGENKEEQIFNISLELCITWINRILFLKLLEGQLITYHQGNKEFGFLDYETIHDFDELFKLFHKVLAVNISERTEAIKAKYNRVPYLNSSLFEISDLEDQTVKINTLENDGKLELISTTVLKDIKKKVDKLPPLEYLFRFLDAYDFASEGTEDIQEDNKTLINASVLGKVFEKINGYKDGSIFTPAFITMYMCRQSIRLAVVEKFNEVLAEKGKRLFDKFDDIKNYTSRLFKTEEVLKANEIINSIHICDPAVGSGHFLVSALNEIIVIKSELGILADEKGNSLNGYEIEIVNDELIITDLQGNFVEYRLNNGKPVSKEIQRLHKTLFHEKEKIIENCLFGVDINPKSVLICRLRLWIELLKNAYYQETDYTELKTLPNIDINIKCGNSLLSRFSLKEDVFERIPNFKKKLNDYKYWVNEYKNAKDRSLKKQLTENIKVFTDEFKKRDPKIVKLQKDLDKKANNYYEKYVAQKLFADTTNTKLQKEKDVLEKEIELLSNQIEELKSDNKYKNAFEWRFEFPEVLNSNGEFEGFDVIIANPPYIFGGTKGGISEELKAHFKKIFIAGSGKINLFTLFIEQAFNLLKQKGNLGFIIPNTFLRVTSYSDSRKYLIDNYQINQIVDLGTDVFDEAITTAIILLATKEAPKEESQFSVLKNYNEINRIKQVRLKNSGYIIGTSINDTKEALLEKMLNGSKPLGELCKELIFGVVITKNKNEIVSSKYIDGWKPFLEGKEVSSYTIDFKNQYLNYEPKLLHRPRSKEIFEAKEKLLIQRITGGNRPLKVAYDNMQFYNKESINNLILKDDSEYSIKYILGILNSRLANWFYTSRFTNESKLTVNLSKEYLSQIPIKVSKTEQLPIVDLVDKILSAKQKGEDSSKYERKIDELVYKLYDITPDEQKIIEG
jgi:hypothetical protein